MRFGLVSKILVPLCLFGLILIGSLMALMSYSQAQNTEQAGVNTARYIANQVVTVRKFYSNEVIPRAKKAGMGINFDFAGREDVLPLPATLVRALGDKIEQDYPGSKVRLYSRYPFPHRGASETYDDFEREAITFLEKNPKGEFHRIETRDGKPVMRYAVADVMQKSCVGCHNTRPDSPKRDWKEGDVRGALEIVTPIDGVASSMAQTSRLLTLVQAILILLAIGMLVVVIRRLVILPIARMARTANEIAQGNLDQHIEATSADELGDMARSFQQMVESLRGIIGKMREAAATVAAGADQISAGTEQLSQSARSQAEASEETASAMEEMAASVTQVAGNAQALAGNVQETSSSMEEMAASITQVAGNAESLGSAVAQTSASIEQMVASIQQVAGNVTEANQVANKAVEAADGGRQAVTKTIEGMAQINAVMGEVVSVIEGLGKSSEEIGNIIEVIDDIAEQTNLLALNAAIEAARAGEHGRGFAVVADEVRKLAERSAKATGEIATLIKGIQQETQQAITSTKRGEERIQDGSKLAQSAGDSLSDIVGAVDQVTRLMAQISQATQEQANASAQITRAVDHMSTLTQQVNAATREQAKGSSQILQAVESMNRMTHQVSGATVEQKKGAEQVVRAVESINRSAREAANATTLIAESSMDLQSQAANLLQAIAFFKDGRSDQGQQISAQIPQGNAPLLTSGRS